MPDSLTPAPVDEVNTCKEQRGEHPEKEPKRKAARNKGKIKKNLQQMKNVFAGLSTRLEANEERTPPLRDTSAETPKLRCREGRRTRPSSTSWAEGRPSKVSHTQVEPQEMGGSSRHARNNN